MILVVFGLREAYFGLYSRHPDMEIAPLLIPIEPRPRPIRIAIAFPNQIPPMTILISVPFSRESANRVYSL